MKTFHLWTGLFLLVALAGPANAQPALSELWPAELGRVWEFDVRVEDVIDGVRTGVLTQTIAGEIGSGGETQWCFDVESTVPLSARLGDLVARSPVESSVLALRASLHERVLRRSARRIDDQPSLLLAVPGCSYDAGLLIDDAVALGLADAAGGWAWWWATSDLTPGSTFRLQLVPEYADDVFLNGEVRTIDDVVTVPAGTFSGVVVVDYVVEMGESLILDSGSGVLGSVTFETTGWVAFAPGVGPIASDETMVATEVDCQDCPPELFEPVYVSMEMRTTHAVSAGHASFGDLKSRY